MRLRQRNPHSVEPIGQSPVFDVKVVSRTAKGADHRRLQGNESLWRLARRLRAGLQILIEKLRRSFVSTKPVPVEQEVVDLVRENQLFEVDALLAQRFRQHYGLGKGHVPVVIAMNQQYR